MHLVPLTAQSDFAVEIRDADLLSLNGDDQKDARLSLRHLLHEKLALLFRNQDLSNDDLMAIASIFGHVGEKDPWILKHRSHNYPDPKYPHIRTVSADLTDPASGFWHADRLYRPEAPDFLILYAMSIGTGAAPTDILNMRELWAKLTDEDRRICEQSAMCHSSRPRPDLFVDQRYRVTKAAESEFVRPLTYTDPITGQVAVCVTNYHDNHIVGMSRADGDALVARIYSYVTVDDYVSHIWSDGDLLVLDNRSTNHRRGAGESDTRVLRRLQGSYAVA